MEHSSNQNLTFIVFALAVLSPNLVAVGGDVDCCHVPSLEVLAQALVQGRRQVSRVHRLLCQVEDVPQELAGKLRSV